MTLDVQSSGVDVSRADRQRVEAILRLALGRLAHRIRGLRVQLSDVNGPKGGEDIRCSIEARLAPRGALRVEETRAELREAVHRACLRFRRSLSRRLDRELSARRTLSVQADRRDGRGHLGRHEACCPRCRAEWPRTGCNVTSRRSDGYAAWHGAGLTRPRDPATVAEPWRPLDLGDRASA